MDVREEVGEFSELKKAAAESCERLMTLGNKQDEPSLKTKE